MPGLDKPLAREERIRWRVIEDQAILVDRDEGKLMRLNPIATEIWQAIDGERTLTELVDHICQTFEVDRKRAQKDVTRFLKKLLRREMLKEAARQGGDLS